MLYNHNISIFKIRLPHDGDEHLRYLLHHNVAIEPLQILYNSFLRFSVRKTHQINNRTGTDISRTSYSYSMENRHYQSEKGGAMSRTATLIVTAGIAMLAIAYACAQQSGSEQQVRSFMDSVFEYEDTGNVEKMVECYDADHVLFVYGMDPASSMLELSQKGAGYVSDPTQWTVYADTMDDVRAFCERYKEMPNTIKRAKDMGVTRVKEVQSVISSGASAIVITRHRYVVPDSEKRITIINEHCSMWMLHKTGGKWKIHTVIASYTAGQMVRQSMPE